MTITYGNISELFRKCVPADLYASEIAQFEHPEDQEYPFWVDSAIAHLLHLTAEIVLAEPSAVQRLVDLATKAWDEGDDRVRNMILVSFFENFDNLEIEQTKAIHRLMPPYMQSMLEKELEPFRIDWMRDGDTSKSERAKRKERRRASRH